MTTLLQILVQEVVQSDLHQGLKRWTPQKLDPKWAQQRRSRGDFDEENILKSFPPDIQATLAKHVARGKMRFLDAGSSRAVWRLGNGVVLKIARNQAGISQNQEEIRASKELPRDIVAQVFRADPGGKWLTMEEVKPDPKIVGRIINDPRQYRQLLGLLAKAGLSSADAFREDHWGRTSDGRMVLMDYGLTTTGFQTHYLDRDPRDIQEPGPTVKKNKYQVPQRQKEEPGPTEKVGSRA